MTTKGSISRTSSVLCAVTGLIVVATACQVKAPPGPEPSRPQPDAALPRDAGRAPPPGPAGLSPDAAADGSAAPAAGRCSPPSNPEEPIAKLSETGCIDMLDPTKPAPGLVPYDVSSPLWSDGSEMERFIALPAGKKIHVKDCTREPASCGPLAMGGTQYDEGHFEVPDGTVLVQTLKIAGRRVETRLLVRFDALMWAGYSYEWNAAQTEATVISADLGSVNKDYPNPARPGGNQTWTFPSRDECISCHLPAAGYQIGLELVQLNRDFTYPDGTRENQLAAWEKRGMFDLALTRPLPAALTDPAGTAGSLEQRARSYLHVNCASCHRPFGIYPGVDLRFTSNLQVTNTCNVVPLKGDLGVMGAMRLAPGRPEASTLTLRMKIRAMGQMPTVATSIVDTTGVQLIEGWIRSLTACPAPPAP